MRGGLGTALLAAALAAVAAGVSGPGMAQAPAAGDSALTGTYWQTEDDKFVLKLERCDTGSLCARLVWLLRPLDKDTRLAKRDVENPSPALRDRPVCGLTLVTGLVRETDSRLGNGSFYNPDDGKTYRANVRQDSGGTMRLRVFLGVEMLGVTMRLRPVAEPTESCDARAAAAIADIDNYFAETPGSPWVAGS